MFLHDLNALLMLRNESVYFQPMRIFIKFAWFEYFKSFCLIIYWKKRVSQLRNNWFLVLMLFEHSQRVVPLGMC